MEREEAVEFVITELGKHRRRSDIVMDVCEMTGMSWSDAQKFVYQVAYEERRGVAARQSPLIVFFGAVFVIGGLVMAVGAGIALASGVSIHLYSIPYGGNLAGIGLGLALIAGGMVGMWDWLKAFFE